MAGYVPERGDVIWLDFEPTKGKEIGKYRPALVLSSKRYARETKYVIVCPISTSIRGNAMEVPIDGLDRPSAVVSTVVGTYSWKDRKAKKITKAKPHVVDDVLLRLIPAIGAEHLFD
ncbi:MULTISPECIES: type II toxin-antitoxin system PemK/MazF family toxin [Vibrio]|uniref:type II toxin-antitoxin system PemK/MazF family toxin n=1 Tax=Vibrio TaxID=662 RepID=UPI000D015F0F|nr:type II toxin-antitoxin system PemK/MazF family toxin [Vibrio gangliei]